jgi:uncharacterized protein YgbK (DUF1537 family)
VTQSSTENNLRLAYYGDDFTGSTDALEFLTRAGLRTRLFLQPPTPAQLATYPNLEAIGVAGLTRSLAPDAMEAILRPAFTALRALGAPHVHYKVCSTFDSSPTTGSIGRAIDIGADIFRARFVPLLVAAPALGRHCVFGNLFARMGIGSAGEIHRLDRHPSMSRHPVTPADEADLRLHLAKQTQKRTALFDILQVALPPAEARAALEKLLSTAPDIVLFDALYASQLATIGALLDAHASPETPLFSVGSSGIEMALGAHWATEGRARPPAEPSTSLNQLPSTFPRPAAVGALLVLSGSCSPVTDKQIAHALAHGFVEIPLDAAALARGEDPGPSVRAILTQLRAGRPVVAHTSRGPSNLRLSAADSARLGAALGQIARTVVSDFPLQRLLFAGGDSSSHAAQALGIESLEMIAPLAPGAPLCRARAPGTPADNLELNFKGGQVGADDYFGAVASGHL